MRASPMKMRADWCHFVRAILLLPTAKPSSYGKMYQVVLLVLLVAMISLWGHPPQKEFKIRGVSSPTSKFCNFFKNRICSCLKEVYNLHFSSFIAMRVVSLISLNFQTREIFTAIGGGGHQYHSQDFFLKRHGKDFSFVQKKKKKTLHKQKSVPL